jgi:hypothetical protein
MAAEIQKRTTPTSTIGSGSQYSSTSNLQGSNGFNLFRRKSSGEGLSLMKSLSGQRAANKKSKRNMFSFRGGKSKKQQDQQRDDNLDETPSMRVNSSAVDSNSQSPENKSPDIILQSMGQNTDRKVDLFQWQDDIEEQEQTSIIQQKQAFKERDGFCRRVDSYDGQVLTVEGNPAYELGNYLGGGVAGVVYEGHRLQPLSEYPVRTGPYNPHGISNNSYVDQSTTDNDTVSSFLCMPASAGHAVQDTTVQLDARDTSLLSMSSTTGRGNNDQGPSLLQSGVYEETALETTRSETDKNLTVIIDSVDAPSRSKHFAKAMSSLGGEVQPHQLNSDASYATSLAQEPVAIKILNPVGFRTLPVSVTQTAVVARPGKPLEPAVAHGQRPMEERHVWWLVNPNSRNLRTLQRYASSTNDNLSVQVDRGSPEKGLRISLMAAYKDLTSGELKELPLTRCIEIWGHVPFGASDAEFQEIMEAIDRVNQGIIPQEEPREFHVDSIEELSISDPTPMNAKRT